jgi:uncharacterized cupredoxin-like copper-binding protein
MRGMRQINVFRTVVRKFASTVALAAMVVVPGILVGCGQPVVAGPVETVVSAELGEFYIKLDRASVPAGQVTFAVSNKGMMLHEMIIIKTDLAANKLPLGREGDPTRVNEDKVTVSGEVADIDPARTKTGTFDLKPGRYLLICNQPGHFASGQWIVFQVT